MKTSVSHILVHGYHSNYTEIGYSISEIFFLGEVGVYVGFDDIKYKSIGVQNWYSKV